MDEESGKPTKLASGRLKDFGGGMVAFGHADAGGGYFESSRHEREDALVGHIGLGLFAHRNLIVIVGDLLDALILRPRLDPHFDMHKPIIHRTVLCIQGEQKKTAGSREGPGFQIG